MNEFTEPWYRQFWPWFIIALLGSAVVASLITVWIAVVAAPDRVDGAGMLSVPVELSADNTQLVFDLGLPPPARNWPEELRVTIDPRGDGETQFLRAERIDARRYRTALTPIGAGVYDLTLEAGSNPLVLRGRWSYPAQVWRLAADE